MKNTWFAFVLMTALAPMAQAAQIQCYSKIDNGDMYLVSATIASSDELRDVSVSLIAGDSKSMISSVERALVQPYLPHEAEYRGFEVFDISGNTGSNDEWYDLLVPVSFATTRKADFQGFLQMGDYHLPGSVSTLRLSCVRG